MLFISTNYRREENLRLHFLIDSGMTQHMTPHREILQDIAASSRQIVTMGNHKMNAIGEGNTIITNDNLQLTNVLLAPGLQDSLLSIAAVNNYGYDVTFDHNGEVNIKDRNKVIAKGYCKGNLFYLQLSSDEFMRDKTSRAVDFESSYVLTVDVPPTHDYKLWHLRLGHLGTDKLL